MKSFQSALHALSFDPMLARIFATTPWTDARGLIDWVAGSDPYGEIRHIRRALQLASASADARRFIEHQVWCAWRQAAWTSGLAEPLEISIEGEEWLRETEGFPTLLVAPMTLATADAMSAIARVNRTDRPCIVFGEDMNISSNALADGGLEVLSGESVSGMARATVRRILEVLDQGGVLCTYPDFVYEGRSAEFMPLFGIHRPVSSGFLSLAARNGAMLLPLVCLHRGEALVIHIEEPLQVRDERPHRLLDGAARTRVAHAVGEMLEGLIRLAPEQWLLLPTLTFESPEMAAVAT